MLLLSYQTVLELLYCVDCCCVLLAGCGTAVRRTLTPVITVAPALQRWRSLPVSSPVPAVAGGVDDVDDAVAAANVALPRFR